MVSPVQSQLHYPHVSVSYESTLKARVTTLALGVLAAAVVCATVQPPGLAILLSGVILVTTFALVFNGNKTAYVTKERSPNIVNENLWNRCVTYSNHDEELWNRCLASSNRSERPFSPIFPPLAPFRDPIPVTRTQYPPLYPIHQRNEAARVPVWRTDPLPTQRNEIRTPKGTERERDPVSSQRNQRRTPTEDEREREPVGPTKSVRNPPERDRVPVGER